MLKKGISLVLCLFLCCGMMLPAGAEMVTVTSNTYDGGGSDDAVLAAAAIGGTIYYLTNTLSTGVLHARTTASTDSSVLGEDEALAHVDVLYALAGELYGLNIKEGTITLLVNAQGEYAPQQLDLTPDVSALKSQDDQSLKTLTSLFAQDGYLYYAVRDYYGSLDLQCGRIDLTSGENQPFSLKNLLMLIPYENGKIAGYQYDMEALYSMDGEAQEAALSDAGQLIVFDPATQAVETTWSVQTESEFGGMAISGFCYGNGSFYYMNGSKITGMDAATGEARISAYTAEGMFGSTSAAIPCYADGYYITYGGDGLALYRLDSENLKNGALRIYGEMGTATHKSFVKNYPDIPVEVGEDYTTSLEAITKAMVTDTNPYDVLLLSLNYMPVDRLLAKGYAADLTADTELWDLISEMYPKYAEVLQKDGKLYGVPVSSATANTMGVNMDLWKELGLSEDDLPTSMVQLLDFAANWVYDYGEDNPNIYLFNATQSSLYLFSLMLNQYMAYTQWKGMDMLFDTPAYRALLDAFQKVDFSEIDGLMDPSEPYVSSDKALISLYSSVEPWVTRDSQVKPLFMSLLDGEEPFLATNMTVMIINPKTTRMDSALLYMKNYLRNLPADGANITLYPDHNQPVEMTGYQRTLDEANQKLDSAKARLETVSAENRAEVQDEVANLEASIQYLEEHRYTVTEEDLQQYRDVVVPLLFVQRQNLLMSADNTALTEINSLMMQYLGGSLDADKMITELDNRLRLMALESE